MSRFFSLCALLFLITSCTKHQAPSSSLGSLEGHLILPDGAECNHFRVQKGEDTLFEISLEGVRLRNQEYTFLRHLPMGEYTMVGYLQCEENGGVREYTSIPVEIEIQPNATWQADFKFFKEAPSLLGENRLLFCGDLSLLQTTTPTPCAGDTIRLTYTLKNLVVLKM